MFNFFKRTKCAITQGTKDTILASEAMKLWREASMEANIYKEDQFTSKCNAGLRSELYWENVFEKFKLKWRQFHSVPQGPELEPRCTALLGMIQESNLMLMIRIQRYTDSQLEQIGEFCALVAVLGIGDAVLFDAEKSALVYEHIPIDWLTAAKVDQPMFCNWYAEKTGKSYKPMNL